jgi:hypothetical protein
MELWFSEQNTALIPVRNSATAWSDRLRPGSFQGPWQSCPVSAELLPDANEGAFLQDAISVAKEKYAAFAVHPPCIPRSART